MKLSRRLVLGMLAGLLGTKGKLTAVTAGTPLASTGIPLASYLPSVNQVFHGKSALDILERSVKVRGVKPQQGRRVQWYRYQPFTLE